MAPLTTTRTIFELRVGSSHTIEVLLQIRLSDITWWNSDLYNHERQLYKLLGRRVLPVEFREEIEKDLAKVREDANFTKKKKGEVVIGEANLKKKAKAEKRKGSGGGRKGGGMKGKNEKKSSKKQKLSEIKGANDNASASVFKEKKLKLLREPGKWIMGKSMQVCYMVEDVALSSASTMIFRNRENTEHSKNSAAMSQGPSEKQSSSSAETGDEDKMVPLATFRSWKKLPKRISLWVFKFDPHDPTDLSASEGGAFPRPELLPMADIFRPMG